MGLALLAIIWLITFLSTYFFVAKTWWLPHGASTSAAFIDNQFALTYVLMGIVFVAAQGLWVSSCGSTATALTPRRLSIPTAIPSSKCSGRCSPPCSLSA